MSLQHAAKHLAAHGRGPDTTLVHMSNKEVKSLNDLAMAHGGQLTINPQTGLPEAGFLSSILPMVAGAALTGMSGGVINPMTAGLIVGGGSMLLNPKAGLMGGLMAGLGAYGGAGLGQGLGNLATSEAGTTVANNATEAAAQQEAQAVSARNLEMANQQVAQKASENSLLGRTDLTRAQMESALMPQNQLQPLTAEQLQPIRDNAMMQSMAQAAPTPTGLDAMYQGAKSAVTNPSLDKLKAIGGGSYTGLAQMGLSALAPAAPAALKPNGLNMPGSATAGKQVVPHYGFSPGMVTPTPQASATGKENTYFTPQYRALSDEEAKQMYPGYAPAVLPAADGGLMGYAGGGPVEQMSNNAAMGANTMYPMANIGTSAFATPYQDPRSTNMMAGMNQYSGGTVDAMSGEPNMQGTRLASGGNVELHGHFSADGGQGGGGGFGGQGANGYQSVGAGGSDGGNYNSSLGVSGPPNFNGMRDPSYQQMQQMNQPQGFGPRGPATFNQDYLNTMASLRGQPSSPLAQAAPVQEAPVGIGPPVFAMAGGGIGRSDFDVPDDQPVGPLGSLLRGLKTKQQDANPGLKYAYNPDDQQYVQQQATGGLSDARYNLGGYSDGGRLLRGPGDGVSDSIPAVIGKKQPARLADGEFVVPARIVSEIGNGSTEAGARKLYAMMDRIQSARGKTVGKGKVAKNTRADKYLPA